MFEQSINALRNANLRSAKFAFDGIVGEKTTFWGYGAIVPAIKEIANDWLVRPVTVLAVAATPFVTVKPKAPAPIEIPEPLKNIPQGENIAKAYEQKCAAITAGAESYKCAASFNPNGYATHQSIAQHNEAMVRISLPELGNSSMAGASISAAIGTLGALVTNPGVKALVSGDTKGAAQAALGSLASGIPNMPQGIKDIASQLGKQA